MRLATCGVATLMALACLGTAQAAAVTCGQAPGLRTLTVDPGKVGGVCVTGQVNFNPAEAESAIEAATGLTGAVHLDKDETTDTTIAHETWLTGFNGQTSGNWTVAQEAWDTYDRLFLGFHFGNAGDNNASNPDWFIVELNRADLAGRWSLGGIGAQLNGLSHIDLIGLDDGGGGGGGNVPEPASLALVGLALLAARAARRSG